MSGSNTGGEDIGQKMISFMENIYTCGKKKLGPNKKKNILFHKGAMCLI